MATLAADTDIWRFQPHPEVWLIIAAVIGFGYWVHHVIGPKVVPAGRPIVTRRQTASFAAAVGLLWFASDWPMHDIAEEYLYSVHMVQHLLITMIIPPLFLLATPEWLARLIVSTDGTSGVWVRRLTRPVVAAVLFNGVVAISHLPVVVNTSIDIGPVHYLVHLTVFTTALVMWMPIVSPLPELRAGDPGRMIYLFLNSVLPTVPGGFLTFAESPLYRVYDHPVRLWGIDPIADQQAAGLIMKLAGGAYIWTIIIVLFFRWVRGQQTSWHPTASEQTPAPEPELTFADVQSAFDRAGAPISEPTPGATDSS
jgi:putative membrane protein